MTAAGCDESWPGILEALKGEAIIWLTCVCHVAWRSGGHLRIAEENRGGHPHTHAGRQKAMLLTTGALTSGKTYAKGFERRYHEISQPDQENTRCRSLLISFDDLQKPCSLVPQEKLWRVLREHVAPVTAVKSF